MKYELSEKKNDEITVSFELSAKEWEAELETAYQKHKGEYKKEGFRPGKVPRAVLEGLYGPELFYEDAFNDAFPKYYTQMLKKEKELYPVDYPEIKVEKMDAKGVSFKAIITVLPSFTVEKYTGYKIEKAKVEVKKSEIKAEIERIRERNARFVEITDRPVKEGDLVNLDFSGSVNGEKFEGGTAKDQELTIGSKTFIPGFEEQMIGMKVGEEKDLNVKFPAKYHSKELAGKDAVFAVKVLSIREKELPEVNDEFAKEVSEFESLNALELSIEERLSKEKEEKANAEAEHKLIDAIVNDVDFKVPAKLVDKQLDHYMHDLEDRLKMQGLPVEGYFEYLGTTAEEFRKERRKEAEKSSKTSLVLEQITEKEKIKVTEKDVEEKIESLAKLYGQDSESLKKMLDDRALESIAQEILTEKVINFLKEKNEIV